MAQGESECAVAAHRMSADAHAANIDAEMRIQQHRQLAGDHAFHREAAGIGCFGGIQPEAGAFAEFPIAGSGFNSGFARTGVGRDDGKTEFGRHPLGAGFDGEGFFGAGQSGQKHQRRHMALPVRTEHAETDRTAAGLGVITVKPLHAAEAALFAQHLETPAQSSQ